MDMNYVGNVNSSLTTLHKTLNWIMHQDNKTDTEKHTEAMVAIARPNFANLSRYAGMKGGVVSNFKKNASYDIIPEIEQKENEVKRAVYNSSSVRTMFNLLSNPAKNIAPSVQSAQDFFKKYTSAEYTIQVDINNNNAVTTKDKIISGIENIASKGYKAAFMDLETLGKGDITDFAMSVFSLDENGKLVKDENGGNINVVLGVQERNKGTYRNIIEKRFRGERLIGDEKVVFDRLALASSTKSIIDKKDGVYFYSSFADKTDADVVRPDKQRMIDALDELVNINAEYKKQSLIDFKGTKVLPIESKILQALQYVKDNDLTIAAHNGIQFDFPRFDSYFSNSENVTHNMVDLMKDLNMASQQSFDSLAMQNVLFPRSQMERYLINHEELAKNLGAHGTTLNTVTGLMLQLDTLPLNSNKSINEELLERRNSAVNIANHVADQDIQDMARAVLTHLKVNPRYEKAIDKIRNSKENTTLGIGDVFVVNNPNMIDSSGNGMITFQRDLYSGDLRLQDGFQIKNIDSQIPIDKMATPSDVQFRPFSFKKDVAYEIKSISNFELPDSALAELSRLNENLTSGKDLFSIEFQEVRQNPSNINTRSSSPIFMVGTKDDIQRRMGRYFDYAFTFKDEITKNVETGEETSKRIITNTNNASKKLRNNFPIRSNPEGNYSYDVEGLINLSETVSNEKSAIRWIGEHDSFSKAKKIMTLIDSINEEVAQRKTLPEGNPLLERANINNVLDDLINVSNSQGFAIDKRAVGFLSNNFKPITKPDGTLDYKDAQNFLFNLFKYRTANGTTLTSNTIDSVAENVSYYNKMAHIVNPVLKKAQEMAANVGAENNTNVLNYYYKNLMTQVMSALSSDDRVIRVKQEPITQAQRNTAYFDMTNVYNRNHKFKIQASNDMQKRVLGINLDTNSNQFFGSELADIYGLDKDSAKDRVKAIKLFAREYSFESLGDLKTNEHQSEEYLSGLIRRELLFIRNEKPNAFFDYDLATRMQKKGYIKTPWIAINGLNPNIDSSVSPEQKTETVNKIINTVAGNIPRVDNTTAFFKKLNPESTPQDYIDNKDAVENLVDQALDILSADGRKVRKLGKDALMNTYGYNEHTANIILQNAATREKDTQKLLTELFTSLAGNGFQISVNNQAGKIGILNSKDEILDITNNLPIDVFNEKFGSLYTRIGKQTMASPLAILRNKEKHLILGTNILKALQNNKHYLKRQRDLLDTDDDAFLGAQLFFKNMREDMAVYATNSMDAKESKLTRMLDISDFLENIGEYAINSSQNGYFRKGYENDYKEFADLLNKAANEYHTDGKVSKKTEKTITEYVKMSPQIFMDSLNIENEDIKREERQFLEEAVKRANMRTKVVKNPYVSISDEITSPFAQYGLDKRGVYGVADAALEFDKTAYDNGYVPEGLEFGTGINTAQGYAYESPKTANAKTANRAARINRLSMSTASFIKIMSSDEGQTYLRSAVNNDEAAFGRIVSRIESVFLEENGGIVSPRLLALAPSSSTKKYDFDKLNIDGKVHGAAGELYDDFLTNIVNSIRINRNANKLMLDTSNIKIPKDVYVSEGQLIGTGLNFAMSEETTKAVREGMLGMKFVDKKTKEVVDNAVIQNRITEALLEKSSSEIKDAVTKLIAGIGDQEHIFAQVNEQIKQVINDNFRIQFHLKEIDAQGMRKMVEASEKIEANAILGGIGDFDSKIANVFKKGPNAVKDMLGKQYTANFLSSAGDFEGDFWTKIESQTSEKDFDKFVRSIYKNFGGKKKGLNNFAQALLNEQELAYKAVTGLLEEQGFIEKDKPVHLISNLLPYRLKHGEASGILYTTFLNALEKHKEDGGTVKGFVKEVNNSGIFSAKDALKALDNGNILITDSGEQASVNIDNLNKFITKYGLQDLAKEKDGIMYENARTMVSIAHDENRLGDKFKYTWRLHNNLIQQKYNDDVLQNVSDKLTKAFGEEKGSAIFSELYQGIASFDDNNKIVLSDESKQMPIHQVLSDYFQNAIKQGSGNTFIEYDTKKGYYFTKDEDGTRTKHYGIADNGKMLIDVNGTVSNVAKGRASFAGFNEESINNLVDHFNDLGQSNISLEYALGVHSEATYEAANKFNKMSAKQQEKALERMAGGDNPSFSLINVNDLDVKAGFNFGNENSIFGKAMIIDLGENATSALQGQYVKNQAEQDAAREALIEKYQAAYANKGLDFDIENPQIKRKIENQLPIIGESPRRYIAVGFDATKFMDDEGTIELRKQVASDITGLVNAVSRYNDDVMEAAGDPLLMPKTNYIARSLDKLASSVAARAESKKGVAAENMSVYLDNSGRFKGGIIRTLSGSGFDSSEGLLGRALYRGQDLTTLANKGLEVNAAFVGEDFVNRVYAQDVEQLNSIFGKNTISLDTVKDILKTEGTNATALRYPAIYTGSITPSKLYLGENLASNQALFTESMARAMKLDMDGDTNYIHVNKQLADVTAPIYSKDGSISSYKTVSMNLDLLTARALENNGKGIQVQFRDNGELFKSMEAGSLAHAEGGLQHYAGEVSKLVEDFSLSVPQNSGLSPIDVTETTKAGIAKTVFNNTLSPQVFSNQLSNEANGNMYAAYMDVAKDAGIYNPEEGNFSQLRNAEVIKSKGQDYLAELMQNPNIDNATKEKNAMLLGYGYNLARNAEEVSGKLAKDITGLVNYNTNMVRVLANDMAASGYAPDFTEKDNIIVNKIMQGIDENFQAAKNTTKDVSNAEFKTAEDKVGEAVGNLLSVNYQNANSESYDKPNDTATIWKRQKRRDRFFDYLFNDLNIFDTKEIKQANNPVINEYINAKSEGNLAAEELDKLRVNAEQEVKNAFNHMLPINFDLSPSYKNSIRYASATPENASNVEPIALEELSGDGGKTAQARHIQEVSGYADRIGLTSEEAPHARMARMGTQITGEIIDRAKQSAEEEAEKQQRISKGYERAVEEEAPRLETSFSQDTLRSVGSSVERAVESLKGVKSIGVKLGLGLAAGLIGAGFVGGNPSEPADGMASGVSADQIRSGNYAVPDYSGGINQGAPAGYVIHVNGNSSQGRDAVQNAVNQAFSQTFNTPNVNLTMNIQSSSSNISNRDILRHISDLLN